MEHLYFWLTALSRCCREDLVILHAVAMRLVTHICNLCLLLKLCLTLYLTLSDASSRTTIQWEK